MKDDFERYRKFAKLQAQRRISRLARRPSDLTADDVAQDVMVKLIADWRPSRCRAEAFIVVTVKHQIDAALRRKAAKVIKEGIYDNVVNFVVDPQNDPFQNMVEMQQMKENEEYLAYVGARHAGARDLAAIILMHEEITRRELAKLMAVDPTHIDYLKSLLRPITQEFYDSRGKTEGE